MILLLCAAWAGPLTLGDVLDELDTRVPALQAAEAEVDAAEAERRARSGAFDPRLKGKGSVYGGPYPRDIVEVDVVTKTPLGPSFSVGYERGYGEFPTYDDAKTNASGEWVVGAKVPLLEGLAWNKDRLKLQQARGKLTMAEAKQGDVLRKLKLKAGESYLKWFAMGRALQLAEDQLTLAERRAAALTRQVEEGSRSQLDLLDNERVLELRRAKRADARRKLEQAAIALSWFSRDAESRPQIPLPEDLPKAWPDVVAADTPTSRPDLQVRQTQLELTRLERRTAANRLLPSVDLVGEAAIPLDGEVVESRLGVAIDAPLTFRRELNDRRAAEARVARSEADVRALQEGIEQQIASADAAVRGLQARVEAARRAAQRAEEVLELERRRFQLGGSDLFQLLQREGGVAKARQERIEAELDWRLAELRRAAVRGVELER